MLQSALPQLRSSPLPLPHMENFRFWERGTSPPRPDFSSLTPTHILNPQNLPDLSPSRRIVFHFYGRMVGMEIQQHWSSNFSLSLRQLSSGFHIDEWVWHPVFQKKWIGTPVNVLVQSVVIQNLVIEYFYDCNTFSFVNFAYKEVRSQECPSLYSFAFSHLYVTCTFE
ncbi:hypothetical protein AVEN_251597-1 [Araneus ventricosus]|uniref:Uncharacterized protein n=1 Tax=Araneus ventricosus TaxID=182803 RepID=A0A4Y2TZT9_ARAVE|nr:hypothetical protein AVEN_50321-1 [Araneus ventricosus]GBO04895.1 hypothetical protein AVEN_251597-1 [Araneus ventricosus]